MKTGFTFLELAGRVPAMVLSIYLIVAWAVKGWSGHLEGFLNLLIFFIGAWAWESVLFILHRLKIINLSKYWGAKETEKPIR